MKFWSFKVVTHVQTYRIITSSLKATETIQVMDIFECVRFMW